MATAQKVFIDAQNLGLWDKVKQTDEAAQKVTELLQRDIDQHHVFFNKRGFHDHLVHHLLSLYGTGAPAPHLQKAFDDNAGYQLPPKPSHPPTAASLRAAWADAAPRCLGKGEYYADFLSFFRAEISEKGWEAVLAERLFAGTPAADDLLVRLHAGLLHPVIQLMYGMEWRQPAIVAAALAQACVHADDFRGTLFEAEPRAGKRDGEGKMPRIAALLGELRGREELAGARMQTFFEWAADGVPEVVMEAISKVRVRPEELEERTAEMFDAVVFAAAGAAFHPGKANKFDFLLIHNVNLAPIYLTINAQPWIPLETKARLLEWKIRLDIIQYAARGTPALSLDAIKTYQPQNPAATSVAEIISDLHPRQEDGHAIKLARAAAICQEATAPYADRGWVQLRGDDTWARVHHLVRDAVTGPGEQWVWCAGQDEAWKDVPDRPGL